MYLLHIHLLSAQYTEKSVWDCSDRHMNTVASCTAAVKAQSVSIGCLGPTPEFFSHCGRRNRVYFQQVARPDNHFLHGFMWRGGRVTPLRAAEEVPGGL